MHRGKGTTKFTEPLFSWQVYHEKQTFWQGRLRLPVEMADRRHTDPGGSYPRADHSGQSPWLQGHSGLQEDWRSGHRHHLAGHLLHSHALPVGLDLQADQHY